MSLHVFVWPVPDIPKKAQFFDTVQAICFHDVHWNNMKGQSNERSDFLLNWKTRMLQKQIELTRPSNFHIQTQAKSFSEPLQEHHLTQKL